MAMAMIMTLPSSRNPQPLIHGHKCHEPNQNGNTKQQIPVRLYQHKPGMLGVVLP